jgi:hypothetical protein
MSRLSVSIVSAIAVLVAIPGSASAATSPLIDPAAAAVGNEVTFFSGCFGVVDEPPSEVQVALTQDDEQPDDESADKTLGTLVQDDDADPFTYSFVVPDVPLGDYSVWLECAPGDWRTNLSEPGGAAALTVCECRRLDILVGKFIDGNGDRDIDLDNQDSFGAGWEFGIELTDGTIEGGESAVTDEGGFASFTVEFGLDGTTATLTEVTQEGFEFYDVECLAVHVDEPDLGYNTEIDASVDGDSVTFQLDPDYLVVECDFYNAAQDSGGGETATPPSNTLPPTDAGGSTNTPTSGSWRAMLVLLAGILAAFLVSIPIGRADRTISGRR